MRSVNAPRVAHDATVELGDGRVARAVNLSTGGIFVAAEQLLDPGSQVHLKVNLRDGASPLDVDARVVWRADGGMALRFVALDDVGRRRIQRLVQKREPTQFGKRDVRIHLPALSAPLRASARDLTERGVMIEAELPWLRLGSPVTTELSPERACDGKVQWIGLDVTRTGSARLRIFVDLADEMEDGRPAPPPVVVAAEDALPLVPAATPRRALRWLWPVLAVGGLLSTGVLAAALLRRPPVPTLLPTRPPERDAPVGHVPPRTKIPTESAAAESNVLGEPPATSSSAGAASPASPSPASVAPASSRPRRAHKTHGKREHTTKHGRATLRAD